MTQNIQAQAVISLSLQVSLPGPTLNITSVSVGENVEILPLVPDIPVMASTQKPLADDPSSLLEYVQPDETVQCPEHTPTAFLLADNPEMIYFENFLTEEERMHLISVSEPNFTPAAIYDASGNSAKESRHRVSEVAVLERDPVVKCIEARAAALQEWTNMALEPLSVQKYKKNGYFSHHIDAFDQTALPNRKSTFNVWLDGNCTGGGTHFPLIPRWEDPALCGVYLDCETKEEGTVFRPVAGNALFWENIAPDGSIYEETLHAGLPVLEGTKIGLNIWSWEFPAHDSRGQTW